MPKEHFSGYDIGKESSKEKVHSIEKAHAKFEIEVGALIRKDFAERIKHDASYMNVELKLEEHKGLLNSTFKIELDGNHKDVQEVLEDIKRLQERFNS